MQPSQNADWLDLTQEETLEPDLPIIDPHHHLWDARGGHYVQRRYLLDEMLADVTSGHNIVATVFIECGAMFREDGPEHLRCVGTGGHVKPPPHGEDGRGWVHASPQPSLPLTAQRGCSSSVAGAMR